ncbi:MAG: lipopolysaccharide kinase InaA family protein [Thermodesulfobacteriota bacterium]
MFPNIPIPSSYALIKKGKVYLLIKNEFKDLLVREGIEDLEGYLSRNRPSTQYMNGRILHPSIPMKDGKRMVLRQYAHGGLLRSLNRNLYLFGSRSFRELVLTEEIRSRGIPTVHPIGAIHRLVFPPFYQAYFLSLEVPRAMNLIQYLQETGSQPLSENLFHKRKIIRSAGSLLRQFHRAGFFHGDLQLKNFLVADDQLFLIDFDRSYRKQALTLRERMKNLLRLNRSVEKWNHLGLPISRTDRWRFFLAYAGDDLKIREAMRKALRTYPIRLLLYRWGWAFEKILGSYGSRGQAE